MLSQEQNFEIYRTQTNRSKVIDSLKLAMGQIKRLEAIMHRECASSPCVLRQLEVSLLLVTSLPDENFIVKEKE